MTPTDYEIARAERLGRATARAGREFTAEACLFNANGDDSQRVLAARFTRAYLDEKPAPVDYTD